ncbi:MAG: redox-sensing transcriptional repressor Rex [Chlorobi bacterium]|nr:redox-sensing transcriptional repressor Rex [Chlorobiota bacterium]
MLIYKTITRLIQYRLCLIHYTELGIEQIFSYTLAKETGVSPEQVRKDFSQFGIRGNKKAGYNVLQLIEQINAILSKNTVQKIILVGMGNIGKALIHYKGFENRNMQIVAAFDIDPAKQGRKYRIPVYPLQKLPQIVRREDISNAIIAVPESTAQQVCDLLTENGIRGILNFAPVILKTSDRIMIKNISLCGELEALSYFTQRTTV